MRLHVLIARCGAASRREAERLIAAGRVTVNGETVDRPGTAADPARDTVAIDGTPLPSPPAARTILLYKPRGCVCSRNRRQGPTVFDLLTDIPEPLVCVGRLDKDSEGLLLLTTDGELANRLMHPRYGHRKTYRACIAGRVSEADLRRLASPIVIDGRATRPARVSRESGPADRDRTLLCIELREGRHRQIRRLCEAAGLRLERLIRIAFDGLRLAGLEPGAWRDLTPDEIARLAGGDARPTGASSTCAARAAPRGSRHRVCPSASGADRATPRRARDSRDDTGTRPCAR